MTKYLSLSPLIIILSLVCACAPIRNPNEVKISTNAGHFPIIEIEGTKGFIWYRTRCVNGFRIFELDSIRDFIPSPDILAKYNRQANKEIKRQLKLSDHQLKKFLSNYTLIYFPDFSYLREDSTTLTKSLSAEYYVTDELPESYSAYPNCNGSSFLGEYQRDLVIIWCDKCSEILFIPLTNKIGNKSNFHD